MACHRAALRVVVSGWVRLDSLSAMPVAAYPDSIRDRRASLRFALVTTYQRDRFHRETIERLAADDTLRAHVAAALASWASRAGYHGLILDFEALVRDDTTAIATVIRSIVESAHRRHIRPVVVAVVPSDTAVYASRHLTAADLLLLMLYDEHWATGVPGPIASPEWVRQGLVLRLAEVRASRVVAALPAYGYRWHATPPASVVSFNDAELQAKAVGVPLERDSASQTLHFTSPPPDSSDTWVVDGELTEQLTQVAESLGVRRFALWRLGLEDPAIWRDVRPARPRQTRNNSR